MKALILAAGYATRLYPLTLDRAKPLLPIAGRPIIEFLLRRLEKINGLDEIFVVTNQKFFPSFESWSRNVSCSRKITIVNDMTTDDKTKLGAIGDIDFILKNNPPAEDLLIVAGDNLFDFDLDEFIEFAGSKKPCHTVGVYDVGDRELSKKYGIMELDKENRVIDFTEKPTEPKATLASMCLYYFPAEKLGLVSRYLAEGNTPDAPGNYIRWLMENERVYGVVFRGEWYDIGDFDSYNRANERYVKEN